MAIDFSKFIRDDDLSFDGFESWLKDHEGKENTPDESNTFVPKGEIGLVLRFLEATHTKKDIQKIAEEIEERQVLIEELGPFLLVCKYSGGTFRIPRPMAEIQRNKHR